MGLKKRVEVEQQRRKAAAIKRKLAKWLEETLAEIDHLEKEGVGAYATISTDPPDGRWNNPGRPRRSEGS